MVRGYNLLPLRAVSFSPGGWPALPDFTDGSDGPVASRSSTRVPAALDSIPDCSVTALDGPGQCSLCETGWTMSKAYQPFSVCVGTWFVKIFLFRPQVLKPRLRRGPHRRNTAYVLTAAASRFVRRILSEIWVHRKWISRTALKNGLLPQFDAQRLPCISAKVSRLRLVEALHGLSHKSRAELGLARMFHAENLEDNFL